MENIKKKSWQAWWLAVRIKTLCVPSSAAVSATLLAYYEKHSINWLLAIDSLLAALLITIATNMVNDGIDFFKGKDTPGRLGFKRVSQSGLLSPFVVYRAGIALFILTAVISLPLYLVNEWFLLLIPLSIIAGYCYTGGPFPISYNGLGEFFVMIFFGWILTGGVYFLQSGEYNGSIFVLGTQMGLLATALIAINNFRDIAEDSMTGKKTLAVRFGSHFSRLEIGFCLLFPFVLNFYWLLHSHWIVFLLPLMTFPLAFAILKKIFLEKPSAKFNGYFAWAAQLQILFALLLCLGFAL